MKIDLHVHTNRSDGAFSPEEITDMAVVASIELLAITDHDTIVGSEEATAYAEGKPIRIIPGIELSTYAGDRQVHLLGYGVDFKSSVLADALEGQKKARLERNESILGNLARLGMKLDYEEVAANALGTIGRKHIAEAMVRRGYVKSINEAFGVYLGEGGKAFASGIRLKPEEGVELLVKSGAVVVLAHPCKIKMNARELKEFVLSLKERGLSGMESDYFAQTYEKRQEMRRIAAGADLFVTGGSDFHSFGSAVALGECNCRLSERALKALGAGK